MARAACRWGSLRRPHCKLSSAVEMWEADAMMQKHVVDGNHGAGVRGWLVSDALDAMPCSARSATMSNQVRLFVNDIEVFVPPNTTVLEAAEKVGVQVSASGVGRGDSGQAGHGVFMFSCARGRRHGAVTRHAWADSNAMDVLSKVKPLVCCALCRCLASATTRRCRSPATAACAWSRSRGPPSPWRRAPCPS